jgi:hypothetical protein
MTVVAQENERQELSNEFGQSFGVICRPAVTAVYDEAGRLLWTVMPCVALGDWMVSNEREHSTAYRAPSKREADAALGRVLGIQIEVVR